MPQNYELACSFGDYPADQVVPEHAFVGHDLPLLIKRGLVRPTDKPVTVKLVAPKPVGPEKDKDADSLLAERNRLVEENKRLREDNARFAGAVAELEKERDAFRTKCDEYTVANAHLQSACEDHQTQNDALQARVTELEQQLKELDDLTAPAKAA